MGVVLLGHDIVMSVSRYALSCAWELSSRRFRSKLVNVRRRAEHDLPFNRRGINMVEGQFIRQTLGDIESIGMN